MRKNKHSIIFKFFIFLGGGGIKFAVNRKIASRRGRSIAKNRMSETKVTAPKHLKFRSSLFKGLQGRGTASSSLPQERNPQAHSNSKSKTIKRKAKLTNQKSAMQLKKVKPREVTKITILVKRLICIALILYYQTKLSLLQICERSRANL